MAERLAAKNNPTPPATTGAGLPPSSGVKAPGTHSLVAPAASASTTPVRLSCASTRAAPGSSARTAALPAPAPESSFAAAASDHLAVAAPAASVERLRHHLLSLLHRLADGRSDGDPSNMLPLVGLDDQLAQLISFLRSVLSAEESNSLLLVGPHGSGMRAALLRALVQLGGEGCDFKLVVLHGGALTDDVKALLEISRQLSIDTSKLALDAVGAGGGADEDEASDGEGGDTDGAAAELGEGDGTDGGSDSEGGRWAVAAAEGGSYASSFLGGHSLGGTAASSAEMGMGLPLGSGGGAAAPAHDMRGMQLAAKRYCPEMLVVARLASGGDHEVTSQAVRAGASAALAMLPGRSAAMAAAAAAPRHQQQQLLQSVQPQRQRPSHSPPSGRHSTASASTGSGSSPLLHMEVAGTAAASHAGKRGGHGCESGGGGAAAGAAAGRKRLRAAAVGEGDGDGNGGASDDDGEGGDSDNSTGGGPIAASRLPSVFRGRGGRGRGRGGRGRGGRGGGAAYSSAADSLAHSKVKGTGNRRAYESHLAYVVAALRDGRAASIPTLIVIEDFDAFARRSKQTLLYNLLDLTADRSVHLAVVGMTHRLDVLDLLEKRLKSRFSHRQVLFAPPQRRSQWDAIVRRALAAPCPSEEGGGDGDDGVTAAAGAGGAATASPSAPTPSSFMSAAYRAAWDASVAAALRRDPILRGALDGFCAQGSPVRALYRWLALAVTTGLTPGGHTPLLQFKALLTGGGGGAEASQPRLGDAVACTVGAPSLRRAALPHLSLLEACLVVAAAHAELRGRDSEPVRRGGKAGKRGGAAAAAVAIPSPARRQQPPAYNFNLLFHEVTSKLRESNVSAARLGTSGAAAAARGPAFTAASSPASSSAFDFDFEASGGSSSSAPPSAATAAAVFPATAAPSPTSSASFSPIVVSVGVGAAARWWSIDASVALGAFERLLQSDVFRLVPRTAGAGGGAASSCAIQGPSGWK